MLRISPCIGKLRRQLRGVDPSPGLRCRGDSSNQGDSVNMQWDRPEQRWYLGVHCRRCQAPILFAVDYSDGGTQATQPPPAGMLVLTCTIDGCKHKADYT